MEAQNAVVNAWARQGDLEKAWAWRPKEPTLATYAALLAGCAPWRLSWICMLLMSWCYCPGFEILAIATE